MQNAISTEINPVIESTISSKIKIPYNKRVEQGLRHDLFVLIKENNNKISDVFLVRNNYNRI